MTLRGQEGRCHQSDYVVTLIPVIKVTTNQEGYVLLLVLGKSLTVREVSEFLVHVLRTEKASLAGQNRVENGYFRGNRLIRACIGLQGGVGALQGKIGPKTAISAEIG